MPAPHPRMHGITHVPGGPDPVPGLLPATGSFQERILDFPSLVGYWPMDDPSGDAHDESVFNQPLSPLGSPLYGQPGPFSGGGTSIELAGTTTPLDPVPVDDSFHGTYPSLNLAGGDITVMFYIYPTSYPGLFGGITQYGAAHFTQIRADGTVFWSVASTMQAATAVAVPLVEWTHVACTRDSAGLYVYFNGVLVATASSEPIASSSAHVFRVGVGSNVTGAYYFQGRVAQVALFDEALSQSEIESIHAGGVDTETGDVLSVGPDGVPVWAPPPAPAVTVNGHAPTAASTPKPTPPAPPPPDTDPVDLVMLDQPFTYNGGTFTVQPKTWTTIPFTTPLMERMSDRTGVSAWEEIPIGDPDAGGWLHADVPHMILIPHDMAAGNIENLVQVCLRIDNPVVEGATSFRALRVLETTRQKTLLEVRSEQGFIGTAEGGMTDVFRGPGITVFASGDTGSTGGHPDILFAPNFGLAFYPTGQDWLPYIDGVQSLTRGMRLVAQCWHDATVPLTFSCAPGTTYKPHFVLNTAPDPSWGPPWSTWL